MSDRKKKYRLNKSPDLKPVWKEILSYPGYFFKELISDLKRPQKKRGEIRRTIEQEFSELFNTSGDWVVKIYVLFVLVILPLLMNALFSKS